MADCRFAYTSFDAPAANTCPPTADFDEIRRLQAERNAAKAAKPSSKTFDPSSQRESSKQSLTDTFDTTLYDRAGTDKFAGYATSIPINEDDDDVEMAGGDGTRRLVGQYTASKELLNEFAGVGDDDTDLMTSKAKGAQIADRETDYQKRRFERQLTPTRKDAFKDDGEGRSYREVMKEKEIEREEERVRRKIEEAMKKEKENGGDRMEGVEYRASLKEESEKEAVTDGTRKRVCTILFFSLFSSFFPYNLLTIL